MIDRFEDFLESLEGSNVSVNLYLGDNLIAETVFEGTESYIEEDNYIIQATSSVYISKDKITNIVINMNECEVYCGELTYQITQY
jgi:hypothetical protein